MLNSKHVPFLLDESFTFWTHPMRIIGNSGLPPPDPPGNRRAWFFTPTPVPVVGHDSCKLLKHNQKFETNVR